MRYGRYGPPGGEAIEAMTAPRRDGALPLPRVQKQRPPAIRTVWDDVPADMHEGKMRVHPLATFFFEKLSADARGPRIFSGFFEFRFKPIVGGSPSIT
jgi:hypothetical protein